MKNRKSFTFTLLLIAADALAVLGAYSVAYILRTRFNGAPITHFIPARDYFANLLLLVPFILLFFSVIGTYSLSQRLFAKTWRVIFGAFGALMFMLFVNFFSYNPIFPAKMVAVYGLIFSLIFLAIERAVLYFAKYLRYRHNIGSEKILLVGLERETAKTAQNLASTVARKSSGYEIVATVGAGEISRVKKYKTLANFRSFAKIGPTLIVQLATKKQPNVDQDLLEFAQKNYLDFKFVPREISELTDRIETELFLGSTLVFDVKPTPLDGWGRVAKRLLDVAVSGAFMLVFSWLYLLIAIVNKIVFGHVFFHQTRLTRGDKKFELYKFQTVRNDLNGLTPEAAFAQIGRPELAKIYRANGDKLDDDPRYGGWARLLRKTSLDEIPQLWNVFRGDISLVGPRALIPEELDEYEKKYQILNVKSGLTGLAVVSGRRDLPWNERRKLDIFYVQNWSFALDIQLLFKTFWLVVTERGV